VKEGFRGREWLLSEVTRAIVDPSIEGARRRLQETPNAHIIQLTIEYLVSTCGLSAMKKYGRDWGRKSL
jgi:hypothetical protein